MDIDEMRERMRQYDAETGRSTRRERKRSRVDAMRGSRTSDAHRRRPGDPRGTVAEPLPMFEPLAAGREEAKRNRARIDRAMNPYG